MGVAQALARNARLRVQVSEDTMGNLTRITRETAIAGPAAEEILAGSEYDEIALASRMTPDDKKDTEWVRIEFREHDRPDPHRSLEYMIHRELSFEPQTLGKMVFRLSKHLPTLDGNDSEFADYDNLPDDEADFAEYFYEQVRAITPEDVETLQQVRAAVTDY